LNPIAHDPFVRAVARGLRHHCRVRAGQRLIVAVSGGCDSTALLRALAAIAPRRQWQLTLAVGHVQHHLRQEAEGDADFVAELAGQLGLPLLRADLDLSDVAARGNLESAARKARYDALLAMAASFEAHAVVTAHHGDDQLETVLMRLLRGSSVHGLAGMAWRRRLGRRIRLLRPMLATDRAAALALLAGLGQGWRLDHTNADVTRLRARLRQQVLPVLHEAAPTAALKAVALGQHLRSLGRVLDQAIARARDHVTLEEHVLVLDRVEARQWPSAVLVGLLRQLLIEAGVRPDRLGRRVLDPLARAIRDRRGGVRRFDVAGLASLTVERTVVRLALPR
jgi:tRNA(Ile)-lysidine synthase